MAIHGILELVEVIRCLDLLIEIIQGRCEEPSGTRSEIAELFPELRLKCPHHEISESTRRIKLSRVSCGLKVLQDSLIDVTESVAVQKKKKVNLVDDVDNLSQQDAILHVLVEVGKDFFHDPVRTWGRWY